MGVTNSERLPDTFNIETSSGSETFPYSVKQDKMCLVDQEVRDMLKKRAMQMVNSCPQQFLSTIFLVRKKEAGF